MASFRDRIAHAWNAFTGQQAGDLPDSATQSYNSSYGPRPDRSRLRVTNERSIISSIYSRMSVDIGQIDFGHVRLDDQKRYIEDIDSGLNDCLTLSANVDQSAGALKRDIAMSLFDKGVIAVVPVDTTLDPTVSGSFDVKTLRVAEIVKWYPKHVMVSVYKDSDGKRVDIILEKKFVAIVENPHYSVMNEPNSTLQRLTRKLNLLDVVDEASSSGKLDLIIQLPYVIKSEARRQAADQRRQDVEFQLTGSKYGIAYVDGTEKITQLNRPAENNLLAQVQYLTEMLYGQLGLTPEVMNGTADEATMLNYYNRTIAPVLDAIKEAMMVAFLTKTARTQGQAILWQHDPFKLVPISAIAEIADKFVRNEVLTKNEIRGVIGFKPSNDKTADKLSNPNMPTEKQPVQTDKSNVIPITKPTVPAVTTKPKGASQNGT